MDLVNVMFLRGFLRQLGYYWVATAVHNINHDAVHPHRTLREYRRGARSLKRNRVFVPTRRHPSSIEANQTSPSQRSADGDASRTQGSRSPANLRTCVPPPYNTCNRIVLVWSGSLRVSHVPSLIPSECLEVVRVTPCLPLPCRDSLWPRSTLF